MSTSTSETATGVATLTVTAEIPRITAVERFTSRGVGGTGARPPATPMEWPEQSAQVERVREHLSDVVSRVSGFVAAMLLRGHEGEVVVYSQWQADAPSTQVPPAWSVASVVPDAVRVDARLYAVDFSGPAVAASFSATGTPNVHFGVFTVPPGGQEHMLELARRHAPASLGTPGLVSINFHRSTDGGQVLNVGGWTGFGEFGELRTRPGFRDEKYWTGAARFRPHFFDVAAVVAAP